MLDRLTYGKLKNAVSQRFNNPEEFLKLPADDMLAVLKDLASKRSSGLPKDETLLKAAVVVFAVQSSAIVPDSAQHRQLRDTFIGPPKAWETEEPPTSFIDLSTRWPDAQRKCALASDQFTLKDMVEPSLAAMIVKNEFEIGGLEDLHDSRALGIDDPTLALLVEWSQHSVFLRRPEWYNRGVLKSVEEATSEGLDTRSVAEIEEAASQKEEAERAQARRERKRKRREEELHQYTATKAKFFALLTRHEPSVQAANQVGRMEHAAVKDELSEGGPVIEPYLKQVENDQRLVDTLLPEGTEPSPDTRGKARALARDLAVQFLLVKLQEIRPRWVAEKKNTDLKLRPRPVADPKPKKPKKPTLSRVQKTIRNQIYRALDKYGVDEVHAALRAIFGVDLNLPEPLPVEEGLKPEVEDDAQDTPTPPAQDQASSPPPPPPPTQQQRATADSPPPPPVAR